MFAGDACRQSKRPEAVILSEAKDLLFNNLEPKRSSL
jgi:hypothetical protein